MLSLCMIVKNEEEFLADCLSSIKDLVDEIIILDTGSTDATSAIAKQHDAQVFPFTWTNDFSAARNAALAHAQGDWILVLDADEVLDTACHDTIRQCLEQSDVWGYRVPIFNYSHDSRVPGWSSVTDATHARGFPGFILTRVVRLFRRRPEIRCRFSVHEGVEFSIEEHHGKLVQAPFVIHHYGAVRGTSSTAFKQQIYFSMVQQDCERYPTHPKPFYELGIGYLDLGEFDKAIAAFEQAVKKNDHYLAPYHYLGEIAFRKGDLQKAKAFFEKSLSLHPEHEETYFRLGQVFLKLEETDNARTFWEKALECNPRSVRYFDALIQLHLAKKEPLQALALLYDAVRNTHHEHFQKQLQDVETQLITEAKKKLVSGPEKVALITLITIAYYRGEHKKVIALCNEAKKYFTDSEGRAFEVFLEKSTTHL